MLKSEELMIKDEMDGCQRKSFNKNIKTQLSLRQMHVLELAYGKDNPDFEKPPLMEQHSIASIVGVTEAYVSSLLRNNYKIKKDRLLQLYNEHLNTNL